MKRTQLLAVMAVMSLTSLADDTASDLVFRFNDGTEQSIDAKNLKMKISDGSIEADNGTVALDIPLSSLQQFYFGSDAGAISVECHASDWSIYNLEGKCVGVFSNIADCQQQLPMGVYVAKSSTTTLKIEIR